MFGVPGEKLIKTVRVRLAVIRGLSVLVLPGLVDFVVYCCRIGNSCPWFTYQEGTTAGIWLG